MKKLSTIASLAGSFIISIASSAGTFYSQGSLDPTLTTSWNSLRSGGGASPLNFTSGDVFIIQDAHVMTTGATWTISGSGSKIWIEGGGSLVATNAIDVTASTVFQIDDGGTYVHDNATAFGGSVFAGTELFSTGSTVELQNSNATGPSNVVFGNLTINLVHVANNVNFNGAISTINGNFSIQSTNGFELRISTNAAYTLNINGNLLISSGTVNTSAGSIADRLFQLNLGGNFIQTGGTFTHTNVASGSQLNFVFTGATKSFTKTEGSLNAANINWSINNGASITFNDDFSVAASRSFIMNATSSLVLTPGTSLNIAGAADFNHQSVTLKSSIDGTARIGQITGSLANATNVTVERFIGSNTPRRAWRLLSSPVSGTTINAAWQEGTTSGNPNAGYGTHITGGSSSNGFDAAGNASIKTYNGSSWVTNIITATNSGDITDQQGYMLFIRGDRSVNLAQGSGATPTNTILRATGAIRQGTLSNYVTVSSSNYTLIGNPYPSAIDFEAIHTDHPAITGFYTWDPNLAGTFGLGGYNFVERTGPGTYEVTPHTGSASNDNNARYIPAGAAILLQGPGSVVNVSLNESYKTTQQHSLNFFKTHVADPSIAVNLLKGSSTLDGVRVRYGSSYADSITSEDARKMINNHENLAIHSGNHLLIVEKRKLPSQADTVFLKLYGMKPGAYQLTLFPEQFTGFNVQLQDYYLNTNTPVNTSSPTNLSFVADTNIASYSNRFRLIVTPSQPLPLLFASSWVQRVNTYNKIEWRMNTLTNGGSFNIERSNNGVHFFMIGSATSSNTVYYTFVDSFPLTGINYYRIRFASGPAVVFSAIMKIGIQRQDFDVAIYPNPSPNKRVAVHVNWSRAGTYAIKIYTALGTLVYNKKVQMQAGSRTEVLDLSYLSGGTYFIEVSNQLSRSTKPLTLQ